MFHGELRSGLTASLGCASAGTVAPTLRNVSTHVCVAHQRCPSRCLVGFRGLAAASVVSSARGARDAVRGSARPPLRPTRLAVRDTFASLDCTCSATCGLSRSEGWSPRVSEGFGPGVTAVARPRSRPPAGSQQPKFTACGPPRTRPRPRQPTRHEPVDVRR